MTEAEAIRILRRVHRPYVDRCGTRFARSLFACREAPGWIYDPVKDRVQFYAAGKRKRQEVS